MIISILVLFTILTIFWLLFQVTGTILAACIWLFLKLPLAFVIWTLGVACICTLILIPVGIWLIKTGCRLLLPVV